MKRLTIISHTEHYHLADGTIVGLGSTVTEINELLEVFDQITHVAMLHTTEAPPSALPYVSDRIQFVALPAVGGSQGRDKVALLFQAPHILKIIHQALKSCDYFQFRAPTGMGVFVIPYVILFSRKKGWFKYAGNWKQENAPWAYRFQKWLLEKQSRPVTINGFWAEQPAHCLSFENPCLTNQELLDGQAAIRTKTFEHPLELCFVGRLEPAKGVGLILEALASMEKEALNKIGVLHLVGAGQQMAAYQKQVEALALPVKFHGYLSRAQVHQIYKTSQAILLPSASEGFPKVIAEAMNYGCLPIVSDVSSISHYIQHQENGFLMDNLSVSSLKACLMDLLNLEEAAFKQMASTSPEFMSIYSYAYYNQRLIKDIL